MPQRFLFLLVSLLFTGALSGTCSGANLESIRFRQNVNRDWKFKLGDSSGAQAPSYNDALWSAVNLPHTFSLPYFLSTQFYTGYGWYRRHLSVPSNWSGQRVFLEFEGAFQDAQVYVNGTLIGEHLGGYTGFSYDITTALVVGDNVIAVRLNNQWNAQIAPRAGDHTFSGGLYRDVNIVVCNPLHVTWYGTFVTTPTLATSSGSTSTVNLSAEVRNDSAMDRACTVKVDIVDPNGSIVASGSSTQTIAAAATGTLGVTSPPISNPLLWHPDHPFMYHALATVYDGSGAVDDFDTRFGFRWMSWSADQGFFLNGSHYYFHGANVHQDHAGWGDGVTNAGFYRDVQMVKDAGFNFIRGSHYPKDPAFGDACDDLGVLFWSENCFWGIGGGHTDGNWTASAYPPVAADQAPFEQNVLNTLRDMIRIHRNHPSVVAWSVSNEPFFTDSSTMTGMRNLLASEVALVHQLDPTRPAGIGGAQRPLDSTRIDKIGDVAGYNGDGATQSVFQNPGVANVVTEYGSTTADRPGSYSPGWGDLSSQLTNGFPTEYAWRSGQCIWCAFDHGSFAGNALETMGVVDYFRLPKRAWYWYRNAYKGIAPPAWPVSGTATQLGLSADKSTLSAVEGTEDALVTVSILDASGNRLSNTQPVTLTIESGPGEFPTGRSITFTPSGNGDASDIAIRDGWAAIEFRAYQSGTSVIRATSSGLADATLTLSSQGTPVFVSGSTPLVSSRPYARYSGTLSQTASTSMLLALNRPTQASSSAPGWASSQANDGNAASLWQAADSNPNASWLVQLEATYQINRFQITFPTAGNYRYRIEVSSDGVNYVTAVDQSATTNADQTRTATGNFGNAIGFVRVRFTGLPAGVNAGIAEFYVGGGSGLAFNGGQLGGTIIGTPGSYNNSGSITKEAAMDGDLISFFDAPSASGAWVGLDLGSNACARISKVRYCPRPENGTSNYASRMVGGKFQGANAADFSDAVNLFTVVSTPATATLSTQEIANAGAFRFVRYLSPANGSCNVAELEFYKDQNAGAKTLYDFENNANDSSGNGITGAPSGISYGAGKVNAAAAIFNGNTSYVATALSATSDFSVALWVKTSGSSTAGSSPSQWWAGRGLVDGDVSGNAADWGTSIVNGKFAFGIGAVNSSYSDFTLLSGSSINNNAWHHCVATWAMASGSMAIYLDGALSATGTAGAGIPRLAPISLKLGRVASGGTTSSISLNGALDDVRFYDRVLSGAEVAALASGTSTTIIPGAVASLSATAGDGQVTLGWPAVAGATSYLVKRSGSSTGLVIIDSVPTPGYVDTATANGSSFFYTVAACNLAGASADSPSASATPMGLPAVPVNVVAVAGVNQNTLSWFTVPYAFSYSLLRSSISGGPYTQIQTLSGTSYCDTGLTAGANYFYVVTATGTAGTGAYSSEVASKPLSPLDGWRLANFGTVLNAGIAADNADPDCDGLSNLQEFFVGTDPKSALSFLRITQVSASESGAEVSFPTVLGRTYRLERSDTLASGSWQTVQDNIAGTGGLIQVTDPGGASRRFYRIVVFY